MALSMNNTGFLILVQGHLDPHRAVWFGAEELVHTESGNTLIRTADCDQPALFGILGKIRDLGMALIFVRPMAESDAGMLQHAPGSMPHDGAEPPESSPPGQIGLKQVK